MAKTGGVRAGNVFDTYLAKRIPFVQGSMDNGIDYGSSAASSDSDKKVYLSNLFPAPADEDQKSKGAERLARSERYAVCMAYEDFKSVLGNSWEAEFLAAKSGYDLEKWRKLRLDMVRIVPMTRLIVSAAFEYFKRFAAIPSRFIDLGFDEETSKEMVSRQNRVKTLNKDFQTKLSSDAFKELGPTARREMIEQHRAKVEQESGTALRIANLTSGHLPVSVYAKWAQDSIGLSAAEKREALDKILLEFIKSEVKKYMSDKNRYKLPTLKQ